MTFNPLASKNAPPAETRRGWAKVTVAAVCAVVVLGSLVAFRAVSAKKDEKKSDTEVVLEFAPADVATVDLKQLTRTIPLSGSLSPVIQSTVKSKVSGEVRKVIVREGEQVTQGEIIALIDTADLQARLDAQTAALEEAKAKLNIADKNRENNLKLLRQNFISQNAFDTTQSTYDAGVASVNSAVAQMRLARNAMDDAVIRAPMKGIVAKKMVNAGEKVGPDSAMFLIVDLAKMEIEAPAPASEIPSVRTGQVAKFIVDGFGERVFDGRIERINPVTELGSRAITLYLSVANADGALKGGMFAKGTLVIDKTALAPVVPASAIREEAGQAYVFAIEGGKLAQKPVALGLRDEQAGLIEIRSGLATGTQVVSARLEGLKPGSAALVKVPAAAPKA